MAKKGKKTNVMRILDKEKIDYVLDKLSKSKIKGKLYRIYEK